MQCPLCPDSLVELQHDGITLDRCPACGATWFDRSEIAALCGGDAEVERRLRTDARGRTWCRTCGGSAEGILEHCGRPVRSRCPRCDNVLSVVKTEAMDLDLCFGCGGFLAAGEGLELLSTAGEVGGTVARPSDRAEDLRYEIDPSAADQLLARMRAALAAGAML